MTYKEKIKQISYVTDDYLESEMCVKETFKCSHIQCNNKCTECWDKEFKEDN